MPTRLICPLRQMMHLPRCAAATSPLCTLRCQTASVSFSRKETDARTTAASHVMQGIAATLLVTIGLTNPIRRPPQRYRHRCRSPWKGCTWLTVRHAPRRRWCCLLPLRISRCRTRQSAQPPPARIFGTSRRSGSWGHALAPGRKEPCVPRQ